MITYKDLEVRPEEMKLFTPPAGWDPDAMWTGFEGAPLRWIYHLVDPEREVLPPLRHWNLPDDWWRWDAPGSQNHGPLWMSVSALGWALQGSEKDALHAAQRTTEMFGMQEQHGHLLSEAVGDYSGGFWPAAGVCALLAGKVVEEKWGTRILRIPAQRWLANHTRVLSQLRMPDGQVALVGARCTTPIGEPDSWYGLDAALAAEMLWPMGDYSALHPALKSLVAHKGGPNGHAEGTPVAWHRPRQAWRWLLLRAIDLGLTFRPSHPEAIPLGIKVYRWTDDYGAINVQVDGDIPGIEPHRRRAVWRAGDWVRPDLWVEIPDHAQLILGGKVAAPPPPDKGTPISNLVTADRCRRLSDGTLEAVVEALLATTERAHDPVTDRRLVRVAGRARRELEKMEEQS